MKRPRRSKKIQEAFSCQYICLQNDMLGRTLKTNIYKMICGGGIQNISTKRYASQNVFHVIYCRLGKKCILFQQELIQLVWKQFANAIVLDCNCVVKINGINQVGEAGENGAWAIKASSFAMLSSGICSRHKGLSSEWAGSLVVQGCATVYADSTWKQTSYKTVCFPDFASQSNAPFFSLILLIPYDISIVQRGNILMKTTRRM